MVQAGINQKNLFALQIKEQTADLHFTLEQNSLAASLMDPRAELVDYTRYLAAMRGIIAYTEEIIFAKVNRIVPNLEERRKLPLIDGDLEVLYRQTSVLRFRKFGLSADNFSEAFALGTLYVIEGSTLGGRMIVRHLNKCPEVAKAGAFGFLNAYGDDTPGRWKDFLIHLSEFAAVTSQTDDIIKGARETFQAIDQYFSTGQLHDA